MILSRIMKQHRKHRLDERQSSNDQSTEMFLEEQEHITVQEGMPVDYI